jgi:AcrR family transcriptional regulator
MGHREDLLAGAMRCLVDKGYARTTARDIVKASGTNLASIGYHYGSKEALLNQALIQAIGDWGTGIEHAFAAGVDQDASPTERFAAIWSRIVEQFASHQQLWLASVEVFAQIGHVPAVRQALADGVREGGRGLARLFQALAGSPADDADDESLRIAGSLYQALMTGMMMQWLIDPEHSLSGRELVEALRVIAAWHRIGEPDEVTAPAG